MLMSALVNVNNLVDSVCHDLKTKGIHIMYKPVQKKRSSFHCFLLGTPDGINLSGLDQALHHNMVKGEEYLILHGVVSLQLTGEPLPVQCFSFRRNNEDCMLPATYKKESYSTVNGYDDENGLKLLMSELDPNNWNQMAMIWSHMQDRNLLRQVVQH